VNYNIAAEKALGNFEPQMTDDTETQSVTADLTNFSSLGDGSQEVRNPRLKQNEMPCGLI
jgi:hypothetical protein